jgi:release factor glutamine methyltransferase
MAVKIQTIKDIRLFIRNELENVFAKDEIRIISDLIIRTASGITKLYQLYDDQFVITSDARTKIIGYVNELKTGKPVQYVIGETEFYNCRIKLNTATLIPRPETEELVDIIIKENKSYKGKILDFGSGSGCISIALAANMKCASITGFDIQDEALSVSRQNAEINNVQAMFLKNDILNFDFGNIEPAGIIVSNPPYVMENQKSSMERNVLDFEPHKALFVTDSDPLVFYRSIMKIAEVILLPDGRIYFEINEVLGGQMVELAQSFSYSEVVLVKDINGKDRILKGTKHA